MSTASHTYRYGLFSWTVRGEIAKPRRETDARSRAGRGVLKKCVEGLSDEPVGLATQFYGLVRRPCACEVEHNPIDSCARVNPADCEFPICDCSRTVTRF